MRNICLASKEEIKEVINLAEQIHKENREIYMILKEIMIYSAKKRQVK